jgi:hypothetical protein
VYTHGIFVFTLPDVVTGMLPSSISDAVAHESVYTVPRYTLTGFDPLSVITGRAPVTT